MKKQKTRAGEPVQRSRLPTDIYVKKAADQGRSYCGVVSEEEAARLTGGGLELLGPVEADVEFGRDGKGRPCVEIKVRAVGLMDCQRCLDKMSVEIEAQNTVLIVDSWEDVPSTRSDDDVVVAVDERLNVVEVVLDELLVQIPFAPKHALQGDLCMLVEPLLSEAGDGANSAEACEVVTVSVEDETAPSSATAEEAVSQIAFDQGKVIQPFANLAMLIAAKKRQ